MGVVLQSAGVTDVLAQPVPIEVASKEQKKVARKQMQLGIDLFKAEKYEEALEMLRSSHEKVSSPNTRLMIANALVKLERYPEAHAELLQVIADAEPLARGEPKYEKTVAAAKAVMESIADKLAFVELSVAAKVSVNGQPLPERGSTQNLAFEPGNVTFVFDAGEGHQKTVELELKAGQTEQVSLELDPPASAPALPPAPPPPPLPKPVNTGVPHRTLAWVGVGVAGAGAIGFSVFGLMASSRHDQLADGCVGQQCPESLRDVAEEGRSLQTWANVSLGVGIAGLVGATVFFLTSSDAPTSVGVDKKAGDDPAREHGSAVATLLETTQVGVGVGNVSVRGQF